MDSRCSFHMTPNKHWFVNYQDTNGGKVLLGNDHECKVVGIGDVRLKMYDNSYRTLRAVRHVPKLKRKLISLGELARNGHCFKGEGETLKITRGSLVCMKALQQNGIHVLQAATLNGEAAVVGEKAVTQARLWHLRMSNISELGLKELSNQGILEKDQVAGLEKCESCIYGKSTKVKFSKHVIHSSKAPLDYIHRWDLPRF